MAYSTFLFDFDHTLFDTDGSEAAAFGDALASQGINDPGLHLPDYQKINLALWADVEAGLTDPDEVRTLRFERLVSERGWAVDPSQMADTFAAGLGLRGDLFAQAREVLEELTQHATLGLVTNALSEVQRLRIERLGIADLFSAIVISSEVGVAKPNPVIFDIALGKLGLAGPEGVLMVGDSLTSDMQGGHNAGIDTCWFDTKRRPTMPDLPQPTHRIDSLSAILQPPFVGVTV